VTEIGPEGGVGLDVAWPVRIRLARGDPRLRAGMSARVRFPRDGAGSAPAVVVPVTAVQQDASGRFVWVFEPDGASAEFGRVVRRSVRTGPLARGGVLVVEGLAPAEYVVAAGGELLAEGEPVRQVFTDGSR